MFDQALKETNLREAVRTLQANPDLELNRDRWNSIFSAIEERTVNAEENTENLRREFPIQSAARQEMTEMYSALKDQGHLTLYGAVDIKQPLAAGSYTLPPKLLEQIIDMPMASLTPKPTNALLYAGIACAVLEGLLSLSTGIPLNTLVLLTLLSTFLDRLFLNGAIFESVLKGFSPGVQNKILRHEAGHFLVAYLLGCPVEGIVLSAWAALQDQRFATRQVSAGTSFFDPELSHQINTNGQVKRSALDRYSVIVMGGIAAEADSYGRADGGAGDEMALVAFLSQLNGGAWNNDTIRNQARWGALQAVLMLREYKPAYEALVDALERGGGLGDCIHAIERAAREHNLKPIPRPLGFIADDGTWTTEDPTTPVVEEPLEDLKEYRLEMEQKLRELDEQLKQIED